MNPHRAARALHEASIFGIFAIARRPLAAASIAALSMIATTACSGPGAKASPTADACAIEGARTILPASQPEAIRAAIAKRYGVLAVAYDCKGLRVLPECSAPDGYALVPLEPSDQAVSLASAAEVDLNAPAPPGEKAVDAPWAEHLVIAGRAVARRRSFARSDLRGACEGATHVVRRIDVGTTIDVATTKLQCVSDRGELLPSCSRPLRLYLEPIGASPAKEDRGGPSIACPRGAAPSRGKCEVASAGSPAPCTRDAPDACKRDCDAGNPESCAVLGWLDLQDASKMIDGFKLSRAACEAGLDTACGNAAMALAVLDDSDDASKEILSLYTIGCDRGDAASCVELGAALFSMRDPALAARSADYFTRACDLGSSIGCGDLGLSARDGKGVPRDLVRARAHFEAACAEGEQRFCMELGALLMSVGGKEADRARALFEAACKADQPLACMNLGSMYLDGTSVDQSFKRAEELFAKACEAKVGPACRSLGWMREEARGAPRDLPMAAGLYAKGCTMGDPMACAELGRMHFEGLGILRDEARAVTLFEKACDAGIPFACHNLALALTDGRGVAKDPARAIEMHKRACGAGMDRSCRALQSKP